MDVKGASMVRQGRTSKQNNGEFGLMLNKDNSKFDEQKRSTLFILCFILDIINFLGSCKEAAIWLFIF